MFARRHTGDLVSRSLHFEVLLTHKAHCSKSDRNNWENKLAYSWNMKERAHASLACMRRKINGFVCVFVPSSFAGTFQDLYSINLYRWIMNIYA